MEGMLNMGSFDCYRTDATPNAFVIDYYVNDNGIWHHCCSGPVTGDAVAFALVLERTGNVRVAMIRHW